MNMINLQQLRAAVDVGGVTGVTLKGQGGAFCLSVQTRKGGESLIVTAKGRGGQPPQPRRFVDPRKALLLLRDIGIDGLYIDGAQWRPEEGKLERSRPDRAKAMKAAHAAAQHDEWFRAQVAEGLMEADDPATQWVSNDQARASWQTKRADLIRRAEEIGV
jgi:hypothetical protein